MLWPRLSKRLIRPRLDCLHAQDFAPIGYRDRGREVETRPNAPRGLLGHDETSGPSAIGHPQNRKLVQPSNHSTGSERLRC
jgi:hypothetical protein